jgi:hypothetical protein
MDCRSTNPYGFAKQDNGQINPEVAICSQKTPTKTESGDNLEVVKFKGQQLEHHYFPRVIESLLKKMKS